MISNISVIIATFGSDEWEKRGKATMETLVDQTWAPASVYHVHGETLAQARNEGARIAEGDWLLFLDADDSLDSQYIQKMTEKLISIKFNNRRLLQPACKYGDDPAYVIPRSNIILGNYLIIGTLVHRDLFNIVGGFTEWEMYEDWDLWIRCFQKGADSIAVPGAIYNISVNEGSRNNASDEKKREVYDAIREQYLK